MAGPQVDRGELTDVVNDWRASLSEQDEMTIDVHHAPSGDLVSSFRTSLRENVQEIVGRVASKMELWVRNAKATSKFRLIARTYPSGVVLGQMPQTLPYGALAGFDSGGGAGSGGRFSDSEPSTEAGERDQRMREHNDDHRLRLAGQADVMRQYSALSADMREHLSVLQSQNVRLMAQYEQARLELETARDRSEERELRVQQAREELERKQKQEAAFWLIAPIIVYKFLPADARELARPLIKALQENFSRSPAPRPAPKRMKDASVRSPAPSSSTPRSASATSRASSTSAEDPVEHQAEVVDEAAEGEADDGGGTPIEMFLASLKPEQRTKLLMRLSPTQQQIFFDLEKRPSKALMKKLVDSFDSLEEVMALQSEITEEQMTMLILCFNEVVSEESEPTG
jgi:hypothetical protein